MIMGERVVLPEVTQITFVASHYRPPEHPTRQVVLAYVLADLLDLPKADDSDGFSLFIIRKDGN